MTAEQELQKLERNETTIDRLTLPLFLRLSELAKRDEELIESIPFLIQRDYPNTAKSILPLLIEKLKTGKCLLLLDALDEVPKIDRNRIELQEKLDRFMQNYPCSVVCTSRIVGYDGNFLAGGEEVEIVPFGERQIEQYVASWFTNAAEYLSDGSVSAAALIRELRSKPQVRGLVQNPLLLSLICSLYQEKGLTLPARRAQVYEKAVEYMLEKWNQTRHSHFPGKTRAKMRLLQALAYHLSCEDQEVFDFDDLYDWMEDYLDKQAPRDLKDAGTETLIAEFSEEDGILQKLNPDDDQYLFLHRTFQEYFTACYLARAKDGIELAKVHFWEYDWHETISLMAGLMKQPLSLLQAITSEKDDIFQTQLLLAGRCLAECRESSHPLMTEIIDRIYQFWLRYPGLEFIRSVLVAMGQTYPSICEQLQTSLSNEDSTVRWSAAATLEQVGSQKGVDVLITVLNDKHNDLRERAAEALGAIGSDKASDALIHILNDDENINLRRKVAEALGAIGNDKASNALIHALNDDGIIIVRMSIAEALGKIGSDKIIDALIKALNDKELYVRWSAAEALGKIGSDKATDVLINALNGENDINLRMHMAWALGKIDNDKATDILITTLNDNNVVVRRRAVWTLGAIGSNKAIDSLINALHDQDSRVRKNAAWALGKIGNDNATNKLIIALNYGCLDVREEAAEALGAIGSDKAVDALITALSFDHSDVRIKAAQALGAIGNDKAVDALITALSFDHIIVKIFAAQALGKIGDAKAIDSLIIALNDDHSDVRMFAVGALGAIGNNNDKVVDALIIALNDENSNVRWSAAKVLGKIGCSTCLAKLIQSSQIDIYRSDIFSLAKSLAVRFSKSGLPFIPVYPEIVEQYRRN